MSYREAIITYGEMKNKRAGAAVKGRILKADIRVAFSKT